MFSTHFDCVPPFFPSRVEDGVLYGRGACDAKGILAAQIAAAERLRAAGETRIGLVFVAGEERGSDGAKAANRIASKTRFLINGEPTDLRLGSATRGCFRVRLTARAGGAFRLPGARRIRDRKADDCLMSLRAADWPSDPQLGKTHYTVGLISGGVAPNVIPPTPKRKCSFGPSVITRRFASFCTAPWAAGLRCRRSSSCLPRACTPCPDSTPRCSVLQ